MASRALPIDDFLQLGTEHLIIDVRSPSEYAHAHIPGAQSLPLFSDTERKEIGTTYTQRSRREAIKIGLDYFGPRMKKMVIHVEEVLKERNSNTALVHCWRGGMRSAAVAWLLDFYGIKTFTMEGGYKAYRKWVISQFEKPYHLRVLSGYTGSGKTEILHDLARMGQPVLDLEGLAGHKGSTFGNLGLPAQSGIQHFENKMAMALHKLTQMYGDAPIWLESESRRIGKVEVNPAFFHQMKHAEHVHIEVPFAERLNKIVAEYGNFKKSELMDGVKRIQKRLGGLETKKTLDYLENGDVENAFAILIRYYDIYYDRNTHYDKPILEIHLQQRNTRANAREILGKVKRLYVEREV